MAVFKKHGNWYIDFYYGAQRIKQKVGSSKTEAIHALAVHRAEIIQKRFQLPRRLCMTSFHRFAPRYLEFVRANKRCFSSEQYRIQYLMRFFRKRNLADFTAWDAEKFKIERAKQVRPATVNRELTTLKSMMSAAVRWDYLTKNPFFGVKPLRVPKSPERILDEKEEEKLLNACSRVRAPHLRPIVLVALHTGMRKGEILSLLWSQIDFASRTIQIINAKPNRESA